MGGPQKYIESIEKVNKDYTIKLSALRKYLINKELPPLDLLNGLEMLEMSLEIIEKNCGIKLMKNMKKIMKKHYF